MNVTGYDAMDTSEKITSQDDHTIVIVDCSAWQGIEYKYQLVDDGLVVDQDFEWTWVASEYDGFTKSQLRHAIFKFRDPVVAGFYRLKWS